MDDWTIRQRIASWLHRLAFVLSPPEDHELIIRDPDGGWFFDVAFEGGFVAGHPPTSSGYTLHCKCNGEEIEL